MPEFSKSGERVYETLVMFENCCDVDPMQKTVPYSIKVLMCYCYVRSYWELSEVDMQYIVPLLCSTANNLGESITIPKIEDENVIIILFMKSALVLIAEDCPDAADTLLYSPLMEQLDRIIDSFVFGDMQDLELFHFLRDFEYRPAMRNHTWWTMLADRIIDDKVVKEEPRIIEIIDQHSKAEEKIRREAELELELELQIANTEFAASIDSLRRTLSPTHYRKAVVKIVEQLPLSSQEANEAFTKCAEFLKRLSFAIEKAAHARVESRESAALLDNFRTLGPEFQQLSEKEHQNFKEAEQRRHSAEYEVFKIHGFPIYEGTTYDIMSELEQQ